MMEKKELSTRIRDLSSELQRNLEDIAEQWGKQGRNQLRSSIGAVDRSTMWMAFAGGIAIGAIAGAVIALLMAPKSGPEMRDELSERARRANGAARESVAPPLG
jgi:gas vesicle protein